MTDKKCPQCGLWNSGSALRCDCGYDFEKETMEESYNKAEISKFATRDAQTALIGAIVGIFIFGIFLEPFVIYLSRKARKTLSPSDDGYNMAKNAETIAWFGLVLWIFVCLFQSFIIITNSINS